jgi:hypothetical protein
MKLSLLPLENDDSFRVRCEGPLSTRGLEPGTDPLQALLGPRCCTHRILLNLGEVPSIDTSGIAWLARTQKAFQQAGGTIVFYNVPPVVLEMLGFLHLTPLLCIAADEPGAKILSARDPHSRSEEGGDESVIRLPNAI